MNDLKNYLAGLGKRQSAVKLAKVTARNGDGTYTVADIATGSERRVSKTNPAEEYAPGSWVYVGAPAAGRTAIGVSDVILSRAPADQRGLSGSVPDRIDEGIPGVVIGHIVPDPIVLVAGGAAVAASIYGAGFLVDAPVYSDPGITDDTAPVVTPRRIDVSLVAGSGVAAGDYDLTIGGTRARGAIEVVAAIPLLPEFRIDGEIGFQGHDSDSVGLRPLTSGDFAVLFMFPAWDGAQWRSGPNLGWAGANKISSGSVFLRGDLGLQPGASLLTISLDARPEDGGTVLNVIHVATAADVYVPALGNVVLSDAPIATGGAAGHRLLVIAPTSDTSILRPIYAHYRGN